MDFLKKSSSYSLSLQGTFGFFKPPASATSTLMFQTWVSFNDSGLNLLERVKPVREQFDTKSMELDDIVQRDIDDARVTGELIPYLLNREGVRQPFRMFPNIIVNLVPVDKARNLLPYHDKISDRIIRASTSEAATINLVHDSRCIFSGALGSGDFCAHWPVTMSPNISDVIQEEYRHIGELRINTSTSELVVVDGQHRAMSLIALYRNVTNSWDTCGRGNKYRQFYEYIWPGLDPNSLSEISLPITICLYPDLSEGSEVAKEVTFTQALRRNFTTLNSPAVPITRERKILLSETDLVSNCMRSLSKAMVSYAESNKESCHYSMYNLEVDKKKDLVAISNKVCSFSISSLHKISELMLLSGVDEYRASLADGGNYGKRALLDDTCFSSRLLLNDLFAPEDKPKSRFNFTKAQANKVEQQFYSSYAAFASKILLAFRPIEYHHSACSEVEISLSGDQSSRLQSILFDGQGQQEVIKEFQRMISSPSQSFADPVDGARFSECKLSVDKDADSIVEQHKIIGLKRAHKLLIGASFTSAHVKSLEDDKVLSLVNFLWDKKYKSIAFQCGLVMTPKILIESFDSSSSQRLGELFSGEDSCLLDGLPLNVFIEDYMDAINEYFAPSTKAKLRDLLSLFNGRSASEAFDLSDLNSWSFDADAPGPRFGTVVTKSMDPKYWCAYRFILLEIYRNHSALLGGKNSSIPDCAIDHLRSAVNSQVTSLREALVEKVYREVYLQNSDSPDTPQGGIVEASIDDCTRRINVILSACGASKSQQLDVRFVKSILANRDTKAGDDLDSAMDEDEVGNED